MKRKITLTIVCFALLAVGFTVGLFVQHNKTGYHYEVRDTKNYNSPIGSVHWSYITESVGAPLLDPGTTILEIDDRIIYKAKRGFQESSPYAQNIMADQNGITWEDGDYQYKLTMNKLKTED